MSTWIAWLITGISTAGFVTIWFITAHRELSKARRNVENSIRQVRLHTDAYQQVKSGPYEAAASGALATSRMIFRETIKNYEHTRKRLINRLPALLLGYPSIGEESSHDLRLHGLRPFVLPGGQEDDLPALRERAYSCCPTEDNTASAQNPDAHTQAEN